VAAKNGNQYVQYGCGWSAPEGWRNFDVSPTLRFERIPLVGRLYTKNQERFPKGVQYGDIISGLPLADNSCQIVYCSHVLEHLALKDLRRALRNTYKILAVGGVFRFVVPDLEYAINTYAATPSHEAAVAFMRMTLLGREERVRHIRGIIREWLGNNHHLWMWDFKAIRFELQQAGFRCIRRAYFGDSHYAVFKEVEVPDRWKNCLGVECEK